MLSLHPLAAAFPEMDADAFERFKQDIGANGVLEPIWLHEGQIIDGRHRYRAACELGLDCPTREFTGSDPLRFVISANLHRRHLSESQRGLVAARLATLELGANQHRNEGAPIGAPSESVPQEEAAEMLNVGRRTVQRARVVIERGAPELVKAVERGDVSVARASVVAQLPKQEQHAAIQQRPATRKAPATPVPGKQRGRTPIEQALDELRPWIQRWGNYGAFSPICQAFMEISRKAREGDEVVA